ncbi:type IV pilus biogenesis protein FimU [Shewanella hafniensis]|uniref:GspH/FimT family pseudopilin n=1 Tax=Shewanella hafniensis TaxID=365590 RepID=UPI001BBB5299|nr:GspH/FimT family pseudopilin [Shewanella hafniensis]MCL1135823.1 GspH/FimT family pseudopilin [Shewanella hafniensis]GIU36204.1 type IV pilus biogenesis protein FimU [Shewanella hafniensis]
MQKKMSGFTLIELMVTITVAAILLTIGIPSLVSLYEGMRVNNNITKIHDIMVFARNQAISYGATVNVCPYASTTSCGTSTDWSKGIRVYIGTDKELRAIDGFHSSDKIEGSVNSLTFTSDGLSSGGTLIYCPAGKAAESKGVIVNVGGIISYGANGSSC